MRKAIFAVSLAGILTFAACHSAPKREAEQQIVPAEREAPIGKQLDQNLDKAFGRWDEPTVERILGNLVKRIGEASPGYETLKDARVHVLATATPYVAPGLAETIYISRGALDLVVYENELAFLLGTQLALLKERATARNLANLQGEEVGAAIVRLPTAPPVMRKDYLAKGWFEAGGLFDLGNLTYLKGEAEGVKLAYAARYDPRGAVTLIQRWTTPPIAARLKPLGKIMPEPEERLANARDEVAKLSPLRDPIVKSQAFAELESRLHVKKAKTKKKRP